jgi:hypothetical protein
MNIELTQEQKINRINWFLNNEPEMAEYVAGTKLDECKKPIEQVLSEAIKESYDKIKDNLEPPL